MADLANQKCTHLIRPDLGVKACCAVVTVRGRHVDRQTHQPRACQWGGFFPTDTGAVWWKRSVFYFVGQPPAGAGIISPGCLSCPFKPLVEIVIST